MSYLKRLLVWFASKAIGEDDVIWIVNNFGELGVKIGSRKFFLYKSYSYIGGAYYREVGKREFGECAHPIMWNKPNGRNDWEKEAGLYSGIGNSCKEFEWKKI